MGGDCVYSIPGGSDEPGKELIWQVGATASHPYHAVLEVNGEPLAMEIDMSAVVSLFSKTRQESLFPGVRLDKSPLISQRYTAETIPVLRQMEVQGRGVYRTPKVVHGQRQRTTLSEMGLAQTSSSRLGECA